MAKADAADTVDETGTDDQDKQPVVDNPSFFPDAEPAADEADESDTDDVDQDAKGADAGSPGDERRRLRALHRGRQHGRCQQWQNRLPR